MYTRPARRRVVVTSGSRSSDGPVRERDLAFLRGLIDAVEALDGEIVVAAPEGVAADLRAERPGLRAGWIPLDVLIHTCDAVVSHGGGVTVMTALSAGVPQLVIPQLSHSLPPALRMSDFGASITLPPAQASAQAVRTAVGDLLDKPGYRERAGDLAREIASLAAPAETVRVVERIVER
jgi:UDP:flavonoid glycosyltransferase YjiC (YdhE family)